MPGSAIGILIDLFMLAAALFALWKGGAAERTAAAVVIANVVIGQTGARLAPDTDGLIRLSNDGLAALAMLFITIRYAAPWLGGVMLFFAAQFSLHSFYLVTDRPHDNLHSLINNVDWSGIAWCLIIATAVAWRRREKLAAASGPAA
jgi:hypothetical protein